MKSFFSGLNFPRIVIMVSFLTSLGLGWFVYDRSARLETVQANLKTVADEITKMQTLGLELDRYQEQASASGSISQQDLQSYIRDAAALREVGVGSLSVDPAQPKSYKNSVDIIYKFYPKNKTQSYSRNSIANFLFKLEFDNRRVKVTSFEMKPFSAGKRSRSKPGEIFADDRWTFDAEITYRTKKEAN